MLKYARMLSVRFASAEAYRICESLAGAAGKNNTRTDRQPPGDAPEQKGRVCSGILQQGANAARPKLDNAEHRNKRTSGDFDIRTLLLLRISNELHV